MFRAFRITCASSSLYGRGRLPLTRARALASKEGMNNNDYKRGSVGLLSGVKNIESSIYYSRKLDLEAAWNLLEP